MSCLWVKLPSWQCHLIVAMSLSPLPLSYLVMIIITFLLLPCPLSVSRLTRLKKVPMMHGATTSTVSSATTPITNVPFAESAASNQVCPLILASPLTLAVGPQTLVHREQAFLNSLWSKEKSSVMSLNIIICSSTQDSSFLQKYLCFKVLPGFHTFLFLLPCVLSTRPWHSHTNMSLGVSLQETFLEIALGEWCSCALGNTLKPWWT